MKPLAKSALLYMGVALSNLSLLEDRFDILLIMLFIRFLKTMGGWKEPAFMYECLSFGFLKGLCVLVMRFRITSRKYTVVRLDATGILRSNVLNVCMMSFRNLSRECPSVLLVVASPSSLYNPKSTVGSLWVSVSSMYIPPRSHTSAPLYVHMLTSKEPLGSDFLTHAKFPSNSRVLLACIIMSVSVSSIKL